MQPSSLDKLDQYLDAPPTELDQIFNIRAKFSELMHDPLTKDDLAEAEALAAPGKYYEHLCYHQ
jgi:hypothetical protein